MIAVLRHRLEYGLFFVLGLFIFYTAAVGPFPLLMNRGIFVMMILLLGLLAYPFKLKGTAPSWGVVVDLVLAFGAGAACWRVILNYDEILMDLPLASLTDKVLCGFLVFTVLELCRRTVGWIFTLLVLAGIVYAMAGNYFPGTFRHRGFDAGYLTETLLLSELGIWGNLVGLAATILSTFIMFASLLLVSGTGQAFVDIASRVGGKAPGGAGKVAIIASGLFGMLAGASVTNVATTGNVTIPMMKRLNYPPNLAAAIEAVASTQGQMAPPILGATAFVMAEFLGISYWSIAAAAIIPAFLSYLGIYCTMHVISKQTNLGHVEDADLPSWSEALKPKRMLPLAAGFGGLIFGIVNGSSVVQSVFFGICGLLIAVFVTRVRSVETAGEFLQVLRNGIVATGAAIVLVAILLIGAQILVSVINLTGLAGTLSGFVNSLVNDNLLLLGLLTAAIGLFMGMGLPTIAAYVLVASVMTAPLENIGVSGMTAHFVVLYYACLSSITPPVCVAVFVAAGIAKTPWTGVAIESMRFAATAYLLPILFLFFPALLLQGTVLDIVYSTCVGVTITIALSFILADARFIPSRVGNILILLIICGATLFGGYLGVALGAALLAFCWTRIALRVPVEINKETEA